MIRSLVKFSCSGSKSHVVAVRWYPRGIRKVEQLKSTASQGVDDKEATATESPKRLLKTENANEQLSVEALRKVLHEGVKSARYSEAEFPSDKRQKIKLQKWFSDNDEKSEAEHQMPERPCAILFPGHGSQFVGMGKKLLEYPDSMRIYEQANAILGFDLLNTCLHGSDAELQATRTGQLAIFVTSVAALEKLKLEHPQAIQDCVAAAGYSVGEYAALVFAGALSFEDALRMVDIRCSALQSLCEATPSGACSVYVTAASSLNEMLVAARQAAKQNGIASPVCGIAEYVATNVKVVGGHAECIRFIEQNYQRFNTRYRPLNVAGACHTMLMRDAAKRLRSALEKIKINAPRIAVYSNYNAEPFRSRFSVIRKLSEAVYNPVKWEQSMHTLYRYGLKYDSFKQRRDELMEPPRTYQVGPGRQLSVLLQTTNGRAFRQGYTVIEV